jgi:intein/homing endonuclease
MENIIEQSLSLQEIANLLSIDTSQVNNVDIENLGLEIETPVGFSPVKSFVVKEQAEGWKLDNLIGTSVHQVLDNDMWKSICEFPNAIQMGQKINVVDLEVPETDCYIANGFVNHNTTPGGWN